MSEQTAETDQKRPDPGWNPIDATVACDWCGECDWCDSLGRDTTTGQTAGDGVR